MHQVERDIDIPFFDLDPMQVVWHGHYVKYLELARCDLLAHIGYDYQKMYESGYAWPVVDMRIQYVKPLRLGQKVRVLATLDDWEYRLKISYVIIDVDSGERLTKGYTTQVAVDLTTEEMCLESPAPLKAALGID
jgi:acyl-CoA thioester hydrolase